MEKIELESLNGKKLWINYSQSSGQGWREWKIRVRS